MKELRYSRPYRLHQSKIHDGKVLDTPGEGYYSRFSTVFTKYGIVCVSELDWAHNNGKSCFTHFSTVINGFVYTAWLDEGILNDRRVKYMATTFIKGILKEIDKDSLQAFMQVPEDNKPYQFTN